jgi:IS605 OrfB family transposase
MTEFIVNTFETRLDLSKESETFLDEYSRLFNSVKHKYYALTKKEKLNITQRKSFLSAMGTPFAYRVFRGIEQTIKGQERSQLSNRKNYIAQHENKLDTLSKQIKKIENRKSQGKSNKRELSVLIKKQERKIRLINKIERLKKDKDSHICFGTSKLLKQRHECKTPEEIEEWENDWKSKRNSEFFLVGSHDENCGNSQCQMTLKDDGYSIFLRTPYALEDKFGHHIELKNITFNYGDDYIRQSVLLSQLSKGKKSDTKGVPLSYRFKKDDKGWKVFVNVRIPKINIITTKKKGVLGVDINADHLAVAEVDGKGNFLNKWTFNLPLRTKTQDQREALIGDAVKEIIKIAIAKKKTIVIENLDFSKKKRDLHKENPRYARMLSALSYQKITQLFEVNCHRSGIELIKINPAYTSMLGKIKYKEQYGLSTHHSAAMVIARRGMNIWDKTPKELLQVKKDQCLPLIPPARMGLSAMAGYHKFFTWYGRFRTIDGVMRFGKAESLLKAKHTLRTSMSGATLPLATPAL